MNINELYTSDIHNKGCEMRVKDQFGKYTDMYITLAGLDSKAWRKAEKAARQAIVDAAIAKEEIPDVTVDMLVAATIGWRGFKAKGKAIKLTPKRARELYESATYIGDQVNNFIGNRRNFTKG